MKRTRGATTSHHKADDPHAPRSFPILWRLGHVVVITKISLPESVSLESSQASAPGGSKRTGEAVCRSNSPVRAVSQSELQLRAQAAVKNSTHPTWSNIDIN